MVPLDTATLTSGSPYYTANSCVNNPFINVFNVPLTNSHISHVARTPRVAAYEEDSTMSKFNSTFKAALISREAESENDSLVVQGM